MPTRMPLRPLLTIAALAAATALALGGCAAESSAEGGSADSSAAVGATVDTLYGEVTVPAHAKRIVALNFPEATALADLGVTPVGRPSYLPSLPAYDELFADVPVADDTKGNPDLEKIASLEPDLIITSGFAAQKDDEKATYDKLSSIAPTVVLEWKQAAGNWPTEAEGTAQAVGLSDKLAALKADYEKHADEIRSTYAAPLAKYSFDLTDGLASSWDLYSAASSHGRVLTDAGARLGAGATQTDGYVQYSPEQYDLLANTDVVIVAGSDAAAIAPVTSNPVFASLPAAKNGRVFFSSHYFSSSYGMANALLDDFESVLKTLN